MILHNQKFISRTCYKRALLFLIFAAAPAWTVEKPTTSTRTCATQECHNNYSQFKYPHGPVSHGVCKFCHRSVDKSQHTFTLFRQDSELCFHCHYDRVEKKNLHQPLEEGQCTQCHNPHGSDSRYLIPTSKVSDLCRNCHPEVLKDKKHLHNPVNEGECTICHNAHSSDHEKLLVGKSKELCFLCHETTKTELDKFEFIHKPVKEKGCIQCHDPHGADNPMILQQNVPELCLSCHAKIDEIIQNASHQHSAVYLKDGCTKCHSPHASTIRFCLKAEPMTLCISCHDKEIDIGDGKSITNIKSLIEKKKYLHGPITQKNCNACHAIHGSDNFRLLAKEFPSDFYAPFEIENYQLCFSCHPENRVLDKETTELTDFRNGNLNLHYLHVNKPKRGRTCRACHAIHASDRPKHIREDVPYGKWNIPIQFKKSKTGGSCKPGCHEPLSYDRVTPIPYVPRVSHEEAVPIKKPQNNSAKPPVQGAKQKEPSQSTPPQLGQKPIDPNSTEK